VTVLVRVAAIVAAAAAAGASAAPATQVYNGRIAVAVNDELVELNPDGSGAWPARLGLVNQVDSWSPDGTRLAINSGGDIWLVDPDGGHRSQLTFGRANDEEAVFSPDGTKIAFASTRDGLLRIWVMNADGSGAFLLTSNFENARGPTWSPDGSEIAFESGGHIWITSSHGVGARQLTEGGARDENPAWSPDGSTIAFDTNRAGNYDVYTVRVSDGLVTQVTSHPADDVLPAWSPDVRKILFTSSRTGSGDLFTVNADGSGETQITVTGGQYTRAAWQPLGPGPNGCTIWGTPANDLLVGSTHTDVICGLGGDDRILGNEGNDVLYGGPGNDAIVGGPGADLIDAGPGNDIVDARDRSPDLVEAGTGTDSVLLDRGLDQVRHAELAEDPEPDNLARGRPVTASLALLDNPAAFAVDGHRSLFWNSSYAPQWIEIDLGLPQTVREVSMVVAQTPDGVTDHVVLGRAHGFDRWRGLGELVGYTHDRQVLTLIPKRPWRNVRYVRIETLKSPSWVAWKEIAVLGAGG
jgi:WD40 repeat protein